MRFLLGVSQSRVSVSGIVKILLRFPFFLPFPLKKSTNVEEFHRRIHMAKGFGQNVRLFRLFSSFDNMYICMIFFADQSSEARTFPTSSTSGNTTSIAQKSPKNLFWRHSTHGEEKIWTFYKFLLFSLPLNTFSLNFLASFFESTTQISSS